MADRVATPRSELVTRVLAAALIAASGVVHLQQFYGVYYRVIPVIGPMFIADFVLAVLIALALLLPVARVSPLLATLVKIGAIIFAAGAIIGLEISESSALFGFHEHGYRLAVVLSLVFEGGAIVVLVASLVAQTRRRRQMRAAVSDADVSWPSEPRSAVPRARTVPRATP